MNKVLLIGSGGREHALAWKLKQSPKVEKIYIAPGNAGTAELGENVPIPATNIGGLLDFAMQNKIDLTIVGPDDPLALGVVDLFQSKGQKIWGPTKAAAQMESSKAFAKDLMTRAGIPTAKFQTFTDYNQAWEYVQKTGAPIVIKASGLALGKGVTVCNKLDQAEEALRDVMINKVHGEAGSQVVIEEYLPGREFSAHAISDGKTFKLFPPSQDHKRVFDKDKGPNTGGMGTIAPVPWVTEKLMEQISSEVVHPALEELKKIGTPFIGLLYPGLIAPPEETLQGGTPGRDPSRGISKVIEFNARFGDPECQSYMRLLKTDLFDILETSTEGKLADIEIEWDIKYACCIVLASGGYPGQYEKGKQISGVDIAGQLNDIVVFHAGTKFENGKLLTNGGRVLGVTAIADDLKSALDKAYAAVKLINFEGMQYRTDIGQKSLN